MDNSTDNIPSNKGTGAGGSNTTYYGKLFEENTHNFYRLIKSGYTKNLFNKKTKKEYDYYLSKSFQDRTVIYVTQTGFKKFMKHKYNINSIRYPDEAYIIEYTSGRKVIKILEKKEQNVDGSVETKLWAGPALKREYEILLGSEFDVCYGFCVNRFLENKFISNEQKYEILNVILNESNIDVLFGNRDNYFETLDIWINNSL